MCTVKVILFASCFGFDTGFAISWFGFDTKISESWFGFARFFVEFWFGFENIVYLCDTL